MHTAPMTKTDFPLAAEIYDHLTIEASTFGSAGRVLVARSERRAPKSVSCSSDAANHWTCSRSSRI